MTQITIGNQIGEPKFTYFNTNTPPVGQVYQNTVESEIIDSDANLFNMKVPFVGADTGSLSLTFLGKVRTVSVKGTFSGTDTDINAFRKEIDDEVQRSNQPDKFYHPSDGGTAIGVQFTRFIVTRDFLNPFKVSYVLELVTANNVFELRGTEETP